MSNFRQELGLQEAAKRFSRGLLKTPTPPQNRLGSERLFRTLEHLMPIQLQVHDDPSRRLALCCTRRAGKSYLAAPWLVESGMRATNYQQTDFFIAPTLDHATGLLLRHLQELKRTTGLHYEVRTAPARVEFPTGARLLFRGAQDMDDLGSLVGYPSSKVWVDECQDIRDEVLKHIKQKVGPALRDLDGTLIFSGTPGRVAAGTWWRIATGQEDGWKTYAWSLFDNTHLPPTARDLQAILKDEGYTVDTPAFKREYLGLWVEDNSLMTYQYEARRNGDWSFSSPLPAGHEWSYVIGVDFGYRPDPSAVIVWAYSHTYPDLLCVGEWKAGEVDYTQLYELGVRPFWELYGPCAVVADAAALQGIAEINNRWGVGMIPGVKGSRQRSKASFIELMNADFINGRIQVPPESRYAHELAQLVWDPAKLPERKEHPRRDNHLCDAGLYAYLHAKHWMQEERADLAPRMDDRTAGWELARRVVAEQQLSQRMRDWANDGDFPHDN